MFAMGFADGVRIGFESQLGDGGADTGLSGRAYPELVGLPVKHK